MHAGAKSYTLPISHIQWNVLLAVNDKVKSAWITAQKRAVTGKGTIVAKDYDMLRENVGYRLSVIEAATASHRANTPAGWTSKTSKTPKTGNDRSHLHGRLYNLSRPIHTVHTKSITAREEIQFASAMARRYARSFRSPSVESDSDVSMRTASPPPEDTQDDRFADADTDEPTTAIPSAHLAEATNVVEDATAESEENTLTNNRTLKVRFTLPEKHDIEGNNQKGKAGQTRGQVSDASGAPTKSNDNPVEPPSAEDPMTKEVAKPEGNGSESLITPAKLDHHLVEPSSPKDAKIKEVPTSATSTSATEAPIHDAPAESGFKVLNLIPDLLKDLLKEVPEENFPARVIPNRKKQQRLEVNQFLHNLFKSKAVSGPRRS
ncbi:hypothetical protein EHS25_009124 [Saitozyma podzolica]|uniref:Uncharacterized protein n=1 Tax=Saitozyma podzolica TaxID=1890683 RepID=A0A427YKX4_9TREE|nr:hypothetical protein EHS25_009124 [Saitozyma podzolica]